MKADPANAGILYVDGHTRVYHGSQTKLPRHHVARQRLCMRATADYWVNGLDGLPFFKVNCAVDPGMVKMLEDEIVPALEKQIPNQPTAANPIPDPITQTLTVEIHSQPTSKENRIRFMRATQLTRLRSRF